MKFGNVAYLWQPTAAQWNRILKELPRENLEALLYDLSLNSGVMSGLEVEPQAAPNLTVKVRVGRGLFRDSATRRGKVMELGADLDLDLSPYLPVGTPSTVLIVAEPLLDTESEPEILVPNAPEGTEDHDPLYTPQEFDPLERDACQVSVVGSPTGQQIVLAAVTLSAGQTQVLASHISYQPRQSASIKPAVDALTARVVTNENKDTAQDGAIAEVQADVNEVSGRLGELERANLPQRVSVLEANQNQAFSSNPPNNARVGAIWIRPDGWVFTKITDDPANNRGIWRSQQTLTLSVAVALHSRGAGFEEYYHLDYASLPDEVSGLVVLRGKPLYAKLNYNRRGGEYAPYVQAYYNVPESATPVPSPGVDPLYGGYPSDLSGAITVIDVGNGRPGGNSLDFFSTNPNVANWPDLSPGNRIWLDMGIDQDVTPNFAAISGNFSVVLSVEVAGPGGG